MDRDKHTKIHYQKLHYKMYKSGKKWVISGILTAATALTITTVGASNNLSAKADVQGTQDNNSSTDSSGNNANASQANLMTTQTRATSGSVRSDNVTPVNEGHSAFTLTNSASTVTNSSSDAQSNNATSASSQSSTSATSSDVAQASLTSSGSFSLIPSATSGSNVKVSGSFSLSSSTTAISGASATHSSGATFSLGSSNTSGSTSSASGTSTTSSSDESAQSSANSNSSATSSSATSANLKSGASLGASASAGSGSGLGSTTTATSAGSNLDMGSISLSASLAANASDDLKSHVKLVDGKYYYYNDGSKLTKSLLVNDNGSYYYFDQNAELTTANPAFADDSKGTITTDANNAVYSADSNNINNVDGFLTPDSWYRPKSILKDGTNWQPSTDTDFRPLLTVWWPSKDVEANYINYMGQQGLTSGTSNYSSTSDQDALNAAAQTVQANIEKKISANNGDTSWLKDTINSFIKTQDQWNANSENVNYDDGYQGGTLTYQNNAQTPDANSDYRLINRNPSQQDGKLNYTKSDYLGYEFLLANDVDNSNPVVQAEDLNWLHYLMNFGSITQNDSNANFDSIRIDALDNIDADVANIAGQYFKDAYKVDQSEQNANNHISILEDWSPNDPYSIRDQGSNQLSIDSSFLDSITANLFANPAQRGNLSSLINGIVDRSNDNTDNNAIPNYSIVRSHDSGVQAIIAQIINDHFNDGGAITDDKLAKAFQIYDADENSTNKQYTQYNLPSAYALMLTNKDTVPRVYYGDMYTDDGQYMSNKTLYFDAIDEMLKGRIKYVAGGQSMNLQYVNGANASNDNGINSILTSVRYGKGADDVDSTGDATTRNSGIAVVMSNNPNLQLAPDDKVVINMGAAHKNQTYRPLVDTTDQGLATYNNDFNVGNNIISTNDNGQLILDASKIKGYSNPQVSGYLSMWVPFGASADQDVRTMASNQKIDDGKTYHSNAALDSNVFYEGFSNFQSMPTNNDQYTNVILAKNAGMFNDWGVTYMELAPQYRSTTDNSFIDSIVQNGYAFNDRYDLGFNTPTKYGTAEQLADAIRSFHNNGIKVIADYVPDQLYQFPNRQVVSVNRTDSAGNPTGDTDMIDTLYDSHTKGSGTDYQAKYGGAFLAELQAKYPDLFTTKQISTGKPIDPTTQIKVWEAKYFNGTNIQGAGSGSVLSNAFGSDYFTVPTTDNQAIQTAFLPKQLSGSSVTYGLTNVDGKVKYVSTSGYVAKNTFLQSDDGNWYYVDGDGDFVTKPTVIKNNDYYFLSNGMNLRNFILKASDGKLYYYQDNGTKATVSKYYTDANRSLYVQSDGTLAVGFKTIDKAEQYFNEDGSQVKGAFVDADGHRLYFDPQSGNLIMNSYFTTGNNWYYADDKGYVLTGFQTVDGNKHHFNSDGSQSKGQFVTDNQGNKTFYDPNSGNLVTNTDFDVDGKQYHANQDGKVLVNDFYKDNNGKLHYFDDTGAMVKDQFVPSDGTFTNFYYFKPDGTAAIGPQDIDGRHHYFDADGIQVHGAFVVNNDDTLSYYDDKTGNLAIGTSMVDGQNYQFSEQGMLMAPNQFVQAGPIDNATTYYLNSNNQITKGLATINGSKYYFTPSGTMLRDTTVHDHGTTYSATDSGILFTMGNDSGAHSGADSASTSSNAASSGSATHSSASSDATTPSSSSEHPSSASSNSADSSAASSANDSAHNASSASSASEHASATSSNASSHASSEATSTSAESHESAHNSSATSSASNSASASSSAHSSSASSSSASMSSASSSSTSSSSASTSSASSSSTSSSSASTSSASSSSTSSSSASMSSASSSSASSSSASMSSASSSSTSSSSTTTSSASTNTNTGSSSTSSSSSYTSASSVDTGISTTSSNSSVATSSASNSTTGSSSVTNSSSHSAITSSASASSHANAGSHSATTSASTHHSSHHSKASGHASHATTGQAGSKSVVQSTHHSAHRSNHSVSTNAAGAGTSATATGAKTHLISGHPETAQNGQPASTATNSTTPRADTINNAINSTADSIASADASAKAARSASASAKVKAAVKHETKHVDKKQPVKDDDNHLASVHNQRDHAPKPKSDRSTAAVIGFAIAGITLMLIGLFIIIKFVF